MDGKPVLVDVKGSRRREGTKVPLTETSRKGVPDRGREDGGSGKETYYYLPRDPGGPHHDSDAERYFVPKSCIGHGS